MSAPQQVLLGGGKAGLINITPPSQLGADWYQIDISSDGNKIAVCGINGGSGLPIYISDDSGGSWGGYGPVMSGLAYGNVSMSASGLVMLANIGINTYIYISTDGGYSWSPKNPQSMWLLPLVTPNGTRMFGSRQSSPAICSDDVMNAGTQTVVYFPFNYSSNNYGICAATPDGEILLCCAYQSKIYKSINGGSSWSETNSVTGNWPLQGAAISADGQRIVAGGNGYDNFLHVSTDGGVNWTTPVSPGYSIKKVSIAGDGMTMAACVDNGHLYISRDGGSTWKTLTLDDTNRYWTSCAVSRDGSTLVATIGGGAGRGVYKYIF